MRHLASTFILLAAVVVAALLFPVLRNRPAPRTGRANRLLHLPFDAVNRIAVARDGWSCEVEKTSSGWHTSRRSQPADATAVQRLLDALEAAPLFETIPARDQAKRNLPLARFGLDAPRAGVRLEAGSLCAELLFGSDSPLENRLFTRLTASTDVFVTSTNLFALLPSSPLDWLDTSFFRIPADSIDSIALRRPGQPFVRIQRSGATWRITSPVPMRADPAAVNALLEAFASTRVTTFLPPLDPAAPDPYGLSEDGSTPAVEFRTASGQTLSRTFGKPASHPPGHVYAGFPGGQAAIVTNALLELASVPLASLYDPALFTAPPDAVTSIAVRHPAQSFLLQRLDAPAAANGAPAWEMVFPSHGPADPARVQGLLDAILRLRAHRVEADLPAAGGTAQKRPAANGGIPPAAPALATNRLCEVELRMAGTPSLLHVDAVTSIHPPPGAATPAPAATPHVSLAILAFTNSPARYIVPMTNLPAVLRAPVDLAPLRSRTLLALDPATIRRIAFRRADGAPATLERTGAGWTTHRDTPVAAAALEAPLRTLATLEAARVIALDHRPDPSAAPWMEISLDLEAANALRKTLAIGPPTEDGGRAALLRGQDNTLVELSPATLGKLEELYRTALGE
ncbi:MAG: DUF4340 domain-containing protein [Kiritimatiellia bacterium]